MSTAAAFRAKPVTQRLEFEKMLNPPRTSRSASAFAYGTSAPARYCGRGSPHGYDLGIRQDNVRAIGEDG